MKTRKLLDEVADASRAILAITRYDYQSPEMQDARTRLEAAVEAADRDRASRSAQCGRARRKR